MRLNGKDLLGISELSPEEIRLIIDTARNFKDVSEREIKKVPTLRGRTVINLFYEPSTRTRTSFEIAAKRMSADAINISISQSSVSKGETLKDTAKNLEAMRPDCIVVRHPVAGTPQMLSRHLNCSIINAGDGMREHPSQALLDLLTIMEHKEEVAGLKVAIVGDIAHSRVARSNIYALTKLGADVTLSGPPTMIPPGIETLGEGGKVTIEHDFNKAISGADVIMMLRLQIERQGAPLFPTAREYANIYGLSTERLKNAKDDLLILHPGPINRGVEITPDVADGPYSLITDQVTNGVAVRMALFYLLLGASRDESNPEEGE